MDKKSNPMELRMFTERLDLIPSVDERDLNNYISDLMLTNDFYFQYGQPYSAELLEAIDFHSSGVIYYSLFLKDTETMVGYVGILPYEDDPTCGELEFYIFRNYRKQGFSKEALTAFINAFFVGSLTGVRGESVEAETLSENEVVIKLLEEMGFERQAWGMRLTLNDDGEINRDNPVLGLRRYILDGETIRRLE